jgi:serine/threonine protein kinase
MWALGCILYELAVGRKAFANDYRIIEYITTKQRPEISLTLPEFDERLAVYIPQLLSALLEIDWWLRPSAREVLQIINTLLEDTTQVYVLNGETGVFRQRLHLYYDDEIWKSIQWRRCWYISSKAAD